jgi:hypothetical protein
MAWKEPQVYAPNSTTTTWIEAEVVTMGRQINFYMLADDLSEFEEAIRSKESVLFVKDRLSAPEIQALDTLTIPEMGTTPLFLYLVRKEDVEKVVIKSVAGK